MARQVAAFMKFCATCNYWMGSRETDYFGNYAKIQDDNMRAKCMCQRGPWRNQERSPLSSCTSYERWSVLRQN